MNKFNATDFSKIVEMAWEDEHPFEAIQHEYYLSERQVIMLMKAYLQPNRFAKWKMHVSHCDKNISK